MRAISCFFTFVFELLLSYIPVLNGYIPDDGNYMQFILELPSYLKLVGSVPPSFARGADADADFSCFITKS